MSGAAQQQPEPPQGNNVVTDPKKAGEGQLFKGDVNEGHDDFQKARESMNQKLRQKEEADKQAEVQKTEEEKRKAKIEGEAEAIVEGIDIDKIAKEVDDDFSIAEKVRSFRSLTPEAQQKLTELRQRVGDRRNKRIEELLNDPDLNDEIDNALANSQPEGQQAPPPQQPQKPEGQQEPAGQQQPGEETPPAQVQEPQKPQQPQQQMDNSQLLESKLNEIRSEFNEKFEKQNEELEQERIRREEAEQKMKEMEEAEKAREQEKVKADFKDNASKLGIPDDLHDVAFGKATEIVNANQRQMTWNEIFAAMKEHYPSLFREGKGKATTDDSGEAEDAGEGAGEAKKKVTVKPGTGTSAGGKGNPPPQESKKKAEGHDSWEAAKKSLSEKAAKLGSGG